MDWKRSFEFRLKDTALFIRSLVTCIARNTLWSSVDTHPSTYTTRSTMHFMLPIVFALGASSSASSLSSFYDPRIRGGSQINKSGNGGEPLNVGRPISFQSLLCRLISRFTFQVIVSGLSSPHVLTARGFLNYARAIGL